MWIDLLRNFGFGVAVIAVVGWFLAYRVWPEYKESKRENQAERKETLSTFVVALERRDVVQNKTVEALENLTDEIRDLRHK